MKRLLIDGNNLLHRMRHTHALLSSDDGVPTGVLHGTIQSIRALLEEWGPDICVFAVDSEHKSWRYTAFPAYKSGRVEKRAKETKEERDAYEKFRTIQIPDTLKALQRLGIIVIQHPRMEADDVISILRATVKKSHAEVDDIIVSSDKDFIQLVDTDCRVLNPVNDLLYYRELNSPAVLCNKKDLPVAPCVMSYLARRVVCGDTSDSIPGIPGVGELTVLRIFNQPWKTFDLFEGMHRCADICESENGARMQLFIKSVRDTKTFIDVIARNIYLMTLIPKAQQYLGRNKARLRASIEISQEYKSQLRALRKGDGPQGRWLQPRMLRNIPNEFTVFFGKRSFGFVTNRQWMIDVLRPFIRLQANSAGVRSGRESGRTRG